MMMSERAGRLKVSRLGRGSHKVHSHILGGSLSLCGGGGGRALRITHSSSEERRGFLKRDLPYLY